jgi:hypothetical protein
MVMKPRKMKASMVRGLSTWDRCCRFGMNPAVRDHVRLRHYEGLTMISELTDAQSSLISVLYRFESSANNLQWSSRFLWRMLSASSRRPLVKKSSGARLLPLHRTSSFFCITVAKCAPKSPVGLNARFLSNPATLRVEHDRPDDKV